MTRYRVKLSKGRRGGFTMMEALIALVLLFIAILGMGALAGSTVKTNMGAHDRTQANYLAEKLLSMMRTEALQWNDDVWSPNADLGAAANVTSNMKLLGSLDAAGFTNFVELTTKLAGTPMAFTPDLKMVAPTNDRALYCAHYKLTWLQTNESILAEVRVYWMRRGAGNLHGFYTNCANAAGNVTAIAADIANVRCASAATILPRNGVPQ